MTSHRAAQSTLTVEAVFDSVTAKKQRTVVLCAAIPTQAEQFTWLPVPNIQNFVVKTAKVRAVQAVGLDWLRR